MSVLDASIDVGMVQQIRIGSGRTFGDGQLTADTGHWGAACGSGENGKIYILVQIHTRFYIPCRTNIM